MTISLEEWRKLELRDKTPLTFRCPDCGKDYRVRKRVRCECGYLWKKHNGYMTARIRWGCIMVPLRKLE